MTETRVVREGFWICPYCGGRNRGRDSSCVGCSAVRGEEVPFEYDETGAEVTDSGLLHRARSGPDWACPFCDTTNRSDAKTCAQCGQSREQGHERRAGLLGAAPPPLPPAEGTPKRRWRPFGFAALLLAIAIGFCFRTKEETLTVVERSWNRSIEVERLGAVRKSDWEGEVPAGARLLGRERAVHHVDKVQTGTHQERREVEERVQSGTRRVKTGTRDLGNGYFEDVYEDEPVYESRRRTVVESVPTYVDRPVYRTKIRYEIDEWSRDRTESASGGGNDPPRWPVLSLGPKEREGKRQESFVVTFANGDGKPFPRTIGAAQWDRWPVGRKGRATRSAARGIIAVEPE
jgi:hypothetical protein